MARVPLYKATETEMLRRITEGEWEVGKRLPNEFGLAEEFGVSQGTMRRALISLESMGYLTRKPGRGTSVAAPIQTEDATAAAIPLGFDRLLDQDGAAPDLEVFRVRASVRGAGPQEQTLFGAGRLAALERTLKRGPDRFAMEEIVAPEARIPAFDEASVLVFSSLLSDHGVEVAALEDRVTAAVTTMSESVALSVDRHTPLLVVSRIAHDASGVPIARQTLKLVADDIGYDITLSA